MALFKRLKLLLKLMPVALVTAKNLPSATAMNLFNRVLLLKESRLFIVLLSIKVRMQSVLLTTSLQSAATCRILFVLCPVALI